MLDNAAPLEVRLLIWSFCLRRERGHSVRREAGWKPALLSMGGMELLVTGLKSSLWLRKIDERSGNVYENKGHGKKVLVWRRRCR